MTCNRFWSTSYLDLVHPLLVCQDGLLTLAQRCGEARVELLLLSLHLLLLLSHRLFYSLASKILQNFHFFYLIRV